jgi:hypothetical protein
MWKELQIGKVERGVIFIVVILITLIFVGYLFVGGTLPAKLPPMANNLNLVQVIPQSPAPQQNSLQLYTFYGATLTPYPTLAANGQQPKNAVPLTTAQCPAITGTVNLNMIWSVGIASTTGSGNQLALAVHYVASHPILLGSGGITQMKVYPADHAANPNVGTIATTDANKFPYSPTVFITDISTTPADTSGDAQSGGTPQSPSDVYGAWKAKGAVDPSVPNGTLLAGGDDQPWPAANGPGGGSHDSTWGAEAIWKMANLKTKTGQALQTGKTYRMQIALHDGASAGSIAQVCANFTMP